MQVNKKKVICCVLTLGYDGSYTSDTMTRFLDDTFKADIGPLRLDDWAVSDVVTVVLVLLVGAPEPKQWCVFFGHKLENQDIA